MTTSNSKKYNVLVPVTSFAGDVDLAAQTGLTGLLPERIDVFNDETTAQNIVLQQKDGTNRTFKIPADSIRPFDKTSFAKIIASGTQTIAEATLYYAKFEK